MIDRRPALIARCAGAADVIAAVRFARTHGLLVSVRGGGHNITGNAVCDGGLMIDLAPMKSVRVDPAWPHRARRGGSDLGRIQPRNAGFLGSRAPAGVVSTTGIAGLTLGGGLGWLMGKHGLSCDNLISADLVTADGQLLTASAEQHPDLFWGLRGSAAAISASHAFEYRLHPGRPGAGRYGSSTRWPKPKKCCASTAIMRAAAPTSARRSGADDSTRRRAGRRHHRRPYRRTRGRRADGRCANSGRRSPTRSRRRPMSN